MLKGEGECEDSLVSFKHACGNSVDSFGAIGCTVVVQESMRTRVRSVLWSVGCVCVGRGRLPSVRS